MLYVTYQIQLKKNPMENICVVKKKGVRPEGIENVSLIFHVRERRFVL